MFLKRGPFAVTCPEHPRQIIGGINDPVLPKFEHGFWCRECKELKWFNENNIKKHLTVLPDKYNNKGNLELASRMREDARSLN